MLQLTDPRELANARAQVERELDAIDRACSRFRQDSELSRVNACSGRPQRISHLFMEALELALHAAELTNGDVDPTVGRALELAGYDRDWRQLIPLPLNTPDLVAQEEPAQRVAITVSSHSGWQAIKLDRQLVSVFVPRGIRLDLGATAKGWAADRAARAAASASGCGVLVGIGGDIATAGSSPAGGWPIRVTDDHRSHPSVPGQTVTIQAGGLATSSTTVRRWHHNGHEMHHIIDPRTGTPAHSLWRTVTAAAASCAEANIATTAALVRGSTAAAWLTEQRLPARLVHRDGHVLCLGDWPHQAIASRAMS